MSTKQEILTGAELIARGAIDAGVDFFAGYPITPASSIYSAMLSKLQATGKVAIGASDEISAIAMCIGASMRGAKTMTATSAPGLCLMTENISHAFVTESPVLIALGQRLGPSTGAATQSHEGDISFLQHIIAGGYTIPVIAINSIFNSYSLTIKAINISEKLRTPVVLLSEKDIIMSATNVSVSALEQEKQRAVFINRPYFNFESDEIYKTYNFNQINEIPEFLAAGIGTKHRVVATGSLHDKKGTLSKTSTEALEVLEHLNAKIKNNFEDLYDLDEESGANTLIISFLASDLSAKEAIKKARKENLKVSQLTIYSLFPVPEKIISELSNRYQTIIIPEVNFSGQYADAIMHLINKAKVIKINSQADLIKPERIYKEIKNAL